MTAILVNKVYDDTQVSLIPSDAAAAAGYVDGDWATYPSLVARFGDRIPLISITVFGGRARIADCEAGDMTNMQVPPWLSRMLGYGVLGPGPYTSASNLDALVWQIGKYGIPRDKYLIWSAHYTEVAHICGPATCGACKNTADATQYTNHALGESLDETLAEDYFLVPGKPKPVETVTVNVTLPVLQNGMADPVNGGTIVHRLQGELLAIGKAWGDPTLSALGIDGVFGPATETAVKIVQAKFRLAQDGVVGQNTWPPILAG